MVRNKKNAKRELTKQIRTYKAERILQETRQGKRKQRICHAMYCEREGETTSDRQKWKGSWKDTRGISTRMMI